MANRNVMVNENSLIAIANSIRNKAGTSSSYTVAQMSEAIDAIDLSAGGVPVIGIEDTVDSHGGIIRSITAVDISDTTAVASNVTKGKTFYNNKGVKTTGTSEGNEGWIRPSDWPNLSSLDISGQVLYLIYKVDEVGGICDFKCRPAYNVEIGDIVNGVFVPEYTYALADNGVCRHYFGDSQSDYKVVRITCTNDLYLLDVFTGSAVSSYDGEYRLNNIAMLIEAYGNLPNCITFSMENCTYLQSCNIKNVKPNSLASAFRYDFMLENVDLSTWNLSNCSSLDYAFGDCQNLKTITIKGLSSSALTLSNVFRGCARLKEVNFINCNTSKVTTFQDMFNGCMNLERLNVPNNFIQDSTTTTAGMFISCYSLKEIDLSLSNMSKNASANSMFYGCRLLKTLNIPTNFVQSANKNLAYMFNGCRFLESIDVRYWNTSSVTNISNFAQNAVGLKEIKGFENLNLSSITNTTSMFQTVYAISTITIPSSLASLSQSTFNGMRGCYEFHFLATTPPTLTNTNVFSNMGDFGGKKIYVPYSADHSVLNAYKGASNWSTYASYIYEEEE